jgi:hypothetical protein
MVTVHIKENHPMAKALIMYLKELSFVTIEKEKKAKTPNSATLKALKDAEQGKTTRLNKGQSLKSLLD